VAVGVASGLTLLHGLLGDPASLGLDVRPMNGRSGLVASCDGRVFAVVVADGVAGAVDHLWVVADPEKLHRWG
jgi:RNA polymerase sigma-70 factor (ECF subfamily)